MVMQILLGNNTFKQKGYSCLGNTMGKEIYIVVNKKIEIALAA